MKKTVKKKPPGARSKVFGGKKKKEQLKEKRKKKREKQEKLEEKWREGSSKADEVKSENEEVKTSEITLQETSEKDRLRTVFEKEPREEVQKRIKEATKPLQYKSVEDLGMVVGKEITEFPKRPKWDKSMSAEELEQHEKEYFKNYLEMIYSKYPRERLNYFEHNLEVWRQLWRVIELSDILLLVADVRHPVFHFPVALFKHVTEDHKKPMILVLNKCDLISKEQQEEWIHWFNENYPDLYVMTFMCYSNKYGEDEKKQKRKKKEVDRDNVYKVWEMCKKVYIERMKKPNADKYWDDLIDRAKKQLGPYDPQKEGSVEDIKDTITVGLIGHPNVGKSCFLNSLVGKTVVSVSLTPGHTKHFQTIFVSRYIRLCDSPGLVFPCIDMPKPLQVLCGTYPIAQVREPYSAIRYLAERVDLVKIYKLQLPEGFDEWSPFAICEAYAIKRGYLTAKISRPDVFRAGNEILRHALSGKVVLAFRPPAVIKSGDKKTAEHKREGIKQNEKEEQKQKPEEPVNEEIQQNKQQNVFELLNEVTE